MLLLLEAMAVMEGEPAAGGTGTGSLSGLPTPISKCTPLGNCGEVRCKQAVKRKTKDNDNLGALDCGN